MHRSGGDPFASVLSLHDQGWRTLEMGKVRAVLAVGNTNLEINSVRRVLDRAVKATDIQITTADEMDKQQAEEASKPPPPKPQPAKPGMERPNKSEPLTALSAQEESRQRARSQMYGQWGMSAQRADENVGFIPCSWKPNTEYPQIYDTDPHQPVVLNLSLVSHIEFHVDVYDTYQWRFFEPSGDHPSEERLIPNVVVLGNRSTWPTSDGQLRSIVGQLMESDAFKVYQDKVTYTRMADAKRANPVLVTQADKAGGGAHADPLMVTGSLTMHNRAMDLVPMPVNAYGQAKLNETADRVQYANECESNGMRPICSPEERTAGSKRKQPAGAQTEYEITPGQMIAAGAPMPEAPADILSAKLAWFETICNAFGVPMSVLSPADATGKAKLTAESAGSKANPVYLEYQSDRRRTLAAAITEIYRVSGNTVKHIVCCLYVFCDLLDSSSVSLLSFSSFASRDRRLRVVDIRAEMRSACAFQSDPAVFALKSATNAGCCDWIWVN